MVFIANLSEFSGCLPIKIKNLRLKWNSIQGQITYSTIEFIATPVKKLLLI